MMIKLLQTPFPILVSKTHRQTSRSLFRLKYHYLMSALDKLDCTGKSCKSSSYYCYFHSLILPHHKANNIPNKIITIPPPRAANVGSPIPASGSCAVVGAVVGDGVVKTGQVQSSSFTHAAL